MTQTNNSGSKLDPYLGDTLVGSFVRSKGRTRFDYDRNYILAGNATPLSSSLPKSGRQAKNAASNWLDNLLPDSNEVRAEWRKEHGLAANADALTLLGEVGEDLPGAIKLIPSGRKLGVDTAASPPPPLNMVQRVDDLYRGKTAWLGDEPEHWSLAGAQDKFPVYWDESTDTFYESSNWRASTHIVKIGVNNHPDSDIAEYLSMRAAHHLGLNVAPVSMKVFGTRRALLIRRYDRLKNEDGTVQRLHQEDLCQALGYPREQKYQQDGGPGVNEIGKLFASDIRNAKFNREEFAKALVYNWLIVGDDAHAKNFSILHVGDNIRLAPLYDLIARNLISKNFNAADFKTKLPMFLGGAGKFYELTPDNLAKVASDLNLDPAWLQKITVEYAKQLPMAFTQALNEISFIFDDSEVLRFSKDVYENRFMRHAELHKNLLEQIRANPNNIEAANTKIDFNVLNISSRAFPKRASIKDDGERVWVPEHYRNGRVVKGYWRSKKVSKQ